MNLLCYQCKGLDMPNVIKNKLDRLNRSLFNDSERPLLGGNVLEGKIKTGLGSETSVLEERNAECSQCLILGVFFFNFLI